MQNCMIHQIHIGPYLKSTMTPTEYRQIIIIIIIIIIMIINALFLEDDILSKYNYLANIWSSATKTKQIIWADLYKH